MNAAQLDRLVQKLIDEELSQEEFAELEHELSTSDESLEVYLNYVDLHSLLEKKGRYTAAVSALTAVPVEEILKRQKRKVARLSFFAAAALIFVSGFVMWLVNAPDPEPGFARLRVTPNSSFVLSHSSEKQEKKSKIDFLQMGSRLMVEHGAVELSLPNEVQAVVEAPADLTLLDSKTLRLERGRAYVEVGSTEGIGFTVMTPHQKIVDLGTAFGVVSDPDNDEVELHVFEGRVRVDSLNGEGGEVFAANRAVSLRGVEVVAELEPRTIGFLKELPTQLEYLLEEDFESGLMAHREYTVHFDPEFIQNEEGENFDGITEAEAWSFSTTAGPHRLLHHWKFDGDAQDEAGASDGTLHGDVAFQAGKFGQAASFDGDDDFIKMSGEIIPESDFTMTAWVWKKGEGEKGYIAGTQAKGSGGAFLRLSSDSPEFHFLPDSQHQPIMGSEKVASQWSHLAVSVCRERGVSLFLDGKLVGTQPEYRVHRPRKNFTVGIRPDWSKAEPEFETHAFEGLIDDLRIFDSVLSPSAIQVLAAGSSQLLATESVNLEQATVAKEGGIDGPGSSVRSRWNQSDLGPALLDASPCPGTVAGDPGERLEITFDEQVKLGTGRVFINDSLAKTETKLTVGDSRISTSGKKLMITPSLTLSDGEGSLHRMVRWEKRPWVHVFNPSGQKGRYVHPGLEDNGEREGILDAMDGPHLAMIANSRSDHGIRYSLGTFGTAKRYHVSMGVGVRDSMFSPDEGFLGYTIKFVSGEQVLSEYSSEKPPGPPNSVTAVSLSWDSKLSEAQLSPESELSLIIAPNERSKIEFGYLDVDNIRVSVVR